MSKTTAALGTAFFFLIAPCVAGGLVPWWVTRWEFRHAFLGFEVPRLIGIALIVIGVCGMVDSFARFALQGLGTPAPVAPPQKLVVTGLYRYVRNPMYVAILAVIFGQALLFGDGRLAIYGAWFWVACHLYVLLYEERKLKRTFGAQYGEFRASVPRWIPRTRPWEPT
jgi:protein-S-isoprenylcysteine O-methyltransferase Ste14